MVMLEMDGVSKPVGAASRHLLSSQHEAVVAGKSSHRRKPGPIADLN
jgi:hypothetical protein